MPSRIPPVLTLGFMTFLLLPVPVAGQAAPELAALWSTLGKPAFDPTKVAMVERVEIHRDAATVTLINGRIALSRALASPTGEQRVFVAAFKGSGRLRFAHKQLFLGGLVAVLGEQ